MGPHRGAVVNFQQQRSKIVQQQRRIQEARAVDVAHPPLTVDEKNLEHVSKLAGLPAAGIMLADHILAIAIQDGRKLRSGRRGEKRPIVEVRAAHQRIRIGPHRLGRVVLGVEAQADEAHPSCERRIFGYPRGHLVQHLGGQRAAAAVGAAGIDEAQQYCSPIQVVP